MDDKTIPIISVAIVLSCALVVGGGITLQHMEQQSIEKEKEAQRIHERVLAEQEYNAQKEKQARLEQCVASADDVYWRYMKYNAVEIEDDGTYTATQSTWNEAQKRKDNKLEECYKLYK